MQFRGYDFLNSNKIMLDKIKVRGVLFEGVIKKGIPV